MNGDLDEAICIHAYYYAIWKRFRVLPERFNWYHKRPDVNFYPLRPEFAESTYFLYMATKSPFYLHVGEEIVANINIYTKVKWVKWNLFFSWFINYNFTNSYFKPDVPEPYACWHKCPHSFFFVLPPVFSCSENTFSFSFF